MAIVFVVYWDSAHTIHSITPMIKRVQATPKYPYIWIKMTVVIVPNNTAIKTKPNWYIPTQILSFREIKVTRWQFSGREPHRTSRIYIGVTRYDVLHDINKGSMLLFEPAYGNWYFVPDFPHRYTSISISIERQTIESPFLNVTEPPHSGSHFRVHCGNSKLTRGSFRGGKPNTRLVSISAKLATRSTMFSMI